MSSLAAVVKGSAEELEKQREGGAGMLKAAIKPGAAKLMLPKGAMADTPEVEADEEDGDSEGPAMGKTVSARSRSGAVVVCPPGLAEDMPSKGSILHSSGECQPCAWFFRPGSCHNGKECGHCHLCPEGEIKARKKKKHAMMRLGLSGDTPKPDSSVGIGEPRKVTFSMVSTFSEPLTDEAFKFCKVDAETPRKVSFSSSVTHTRSEGALAGDPSARFARRARLAAFLESREEEELAEEQAEEQAEAREGGEASELAVGHKKEAMAISLVETVVDGSTDAPEPDKKAAGTASEFFPPGLPPPGPMPSRGSLMHGTGQCRPCAWFWRPGSCQNEADCGHCHMCGAGELKVRKKQKQAMLRLGLATPKPAPPESQDPFQQAFNLAAAGWCDDKRSQRSRESLGGGSSEQESTTASNSELEEDANSVGNDAGSAEVPCSEAGSKARTRVGSFVGLPPGLRAPPGTPSHGSSLHKIGNCWPCAYFWKDGGCPNGEDCGYCHLCPQGEMKLRKRSKQAMMRLGLATPKAGLAGDEDFMEAQGSIVPAEA